MVVTRRSVAVVAAEFLGTALLTLAVFASVKGIANSYFISAGVGLALVLALLAFGSVSRGHFNPAVTIGAWSARRIPTVQAVVYIAAQFLGALAASELFNYLTNQARPANYSQEFHAQVLIAEALGAFVFCTGVATTVFRSYGAARTAAVAGLSLFLGALVAGIASQGIINPALALGLHSWEWKTYGLGPVLGAVIAFNLYSLLFAPQPATTVNEVAVRKTKTVRKK